MTKHEEGSTNFLSQRSVKQWLPMFLAISMASKLLMIRTSVQNKRGSQGTRKHSQIGFRFGAPCRGLRRLSLQPSSLNNQGQVQDDCIADLALGLTLLVPIDWPSAT